ncbi:hypothetical protein GH714_025726 [Hevea brasiliensis]|uniref:Methyltransferase type 11 domain-containing protein n=1 Tax=Hevea brasiliensis TaxID=3981 RepID=A0A6A6M3P7_HEVBR|nr:hypothetical protein GH714_025726 [Hevea brasiliensis]
MEELQEKLERSVQELEKFKDQLDKTSITRMEHKRFLEQEVIRPLHSAHLSLRQIRLPRIANSTIKEEPLINTFIVEEIRKNFQCLSSKNHKRGYSKCTGCFEMEKERLKWVTNSSLPMDFLITDVLAIKPGEIRIGLDFGVGTGTFAARMRESNVTIISTALNLGAPFSEMIALRGLIPLYVTLNQRLPFFDNTMDLIHTNGFMDGWIDLMLMDFILFDWDRILRPGGLLWIDRFFCNRKDLDDYMYMFLQFRYKKHKWAISPKSKDEVYLSAVLEKPPRAI